MKWNFLYQITAASRTLTRSYGPQIPVLYLLCQLNLLNPPNKIPGYATDSVEMFSAYTQKLI